METKFLTVKLQAVRRKTHKTSKTMQACHLIGMLLGKKLPNSIIDND